jgi:hypothetical protein
MCVVTTVKAALHPRLKRVSEISTSTTKGIASHQTPNSSPSLQAHSLAIPAP